MKGILTIFIFLSFLLMPLRGQDYVGSAYKFRHLNSSHGLSNNQITSIYKDQHGFVWFGTISGLNRYDGHSFKVYKNIPGDSTTIPFNNIQRIYEDHRGFLWIFSQDNLITFFDPEKDVFYRDYELFSSENGISAEYISGLIVDQDSNLWVATNQYGIYRVSAHDGIIKRIRAGEDRPDALHSDYVTDIFLDDDSTIVIVNAFGVVETLNRKSGRVVTKYQPERLTSLTVPDYFSVFTDHEGDYWIYSEQSDRGLFYYNPESGSELHFSVENDDFPISSNIVTGVLQDQKGHIWVATDHGGIQIINKDDFSVQTVRKVTGASNSLTQNSITSLLGDDSGTIWIGTYKEGVNYYHPDLFQFHLFSHNPFIEGGLPANDIDCFAEDNRGNLYIGTNGSGLIYYKRNASEFSLFRARPNNPDSLSHDVIVSLLYDSKDRLWVGTYYGGLNCYQDGKFKRYYHDPENPATISDNRIWKIFEDSEGRIWIGTLGGGLDLLDEQNDRFLHYRDGDLNSVNSNFILSLEEDRDGNLWIGTSFGINVLDRNTGRFSHIPANPGKQNALSHHIVLCIIQDQRGLMWIGTRNGLNLYDPDSDTFKLFLERDGLPDNNILNLLEDDQGNIWMSTLNGISRLELSKTQEGYDFSFSNFDLLDGLQGREFNEHSAYKTSQGELFFGGPDGFNMFRPREIHKSPYSPVVLLTGVKLFNEDVEVGDTLNNRVVLPRSLFLSDSLVLRHNQNVFSIEFSGIGFFHPEKIRYQYLLENFNEQWVATDASNRLATYTNLNPGTYRFRVKANVGDNGPEGPETTLWIVIKPPFYATIYAYAIYFLLFSGVVVALGFIIRQREQTKYKRQKELTEHQRIHEMDAMKIRFFTNISHEFRTPLTLIVTPLEKLIREVGDERIRHQLKMMFRNARRLLGLVNQLLDFRKIEVQGIVLHKSKDDVVAFVKDVAVSFSDLFETKSIRFIVSATVDELFMAFDPDKLEKIIFNLLSNAFKYSSENGEVRLTLDYIDTAQSPDELLDDQPYIKISVSDKGIGIPPENCDRIFERFFQAGGVVSQNTGSGIGLSITREFVRLHGGRISVDSTPAKGSVFTVKLPASQQEDLSVSQFVELDLLYEKQPDVPEIMDHGTADKPVLLIIEDNEDLRFYLRENMGHNYRVVEAADGNEGLEKAMSVFPDVIISDLMMPGIDGLTLCKKLKNDTKTSHIPVILLTAKVSAEQEIEGLDAGADDYITKPFNYEVLALKISKQIEIRAMFREKLKMRHFEISPGEIGITSLDEKFIKKATGFVEKNIANTELSVEMFSREMGVSRGHLYNKILALTGKTPTEFIRIMRLKRGAQLLGKSQLNVGEVAFKVGFNDPKYFSRYFKEEFGVSPSEYAKRVDKNE